MDQIDNEMLEKGLVVDNFQLKDQWDKLIDSTLRKSKIKATFRWLYGYWK